ncbi:hypothetical protein ED733_008825 [Metarhizium rileyi]|uniref:Collagen-like protein Mcl1 n=1 Tax=Metarhizium rileyi (strain RCEF 4871) TaxID=1649241 RepID=A0A5C6GQC5_METRR|nr:hypothetical protein ED733_008825 [Metarhizium rileyi]
MKHCFQLLAVSTALLLPATASRMVKRAGEQRINDVPEVCAPELNGFGPMPPCISINNIERRCQPNGTGSLDFSAHAQCMCRGSFFMDWRGCQNCLFAHGFRSRRDGAYWEGVISLASSRLCEGTPTAAFSAIFASAQANTRDAPVVTTGDTLVFDEFPSLTDIGIYYTAAGVEGPGTITGAAAMATTVSQPTATNLTGSKMGGKCNVKTPSLTGYGGTRTTGLSSSTLICGASAQGTGMAIAIAGAALAMAL